MRRFLKAFGLILATSLPAAAQEVTVGSNIFYQYCAACHGINGEGDGPMAPVLLVQPSNLTTLSQRNGDVFPIVRVAMRIDGREPLVSHGSDMPVFGDFFEGVQDIAMKTAAGQPILVSQPVADLVAYLQSLQR